MGIRIFGFSLVSILLVVALIFVVRKWGGQIPVVKSIG